MDTSIDVIITNGFTPRNMDDATPFTRYSHSRMKASSQALVRKLGETVRLMENGGHGIEEQCRSLYSSYIDKGNDERLAFVTNLYREYGADHSGVKLAASRLVAHESSNNGKEPVSVLNLEEKLRTALLPRYHRLLIQMAKMSDGMPFLLQLRADVLVLLAHPGMSKDHPALRSICTEMGDLLDVGLSYGTLELSCIKRDSADAILQKILSYEVINTHSTKDNNLMKRFGPYRRCFTYMHTRLPDTPLVIIHTALTGYNNVFSDIQSIIGNDLTPSASITNGRDEDPNHITVAIFYSVTSTQKGLQGLDIGDFLIPQVVETLRKEFPRIQFYLSLSPIPGFREWVIGELTKYKHQRNAGESPESALLTPDEVAMLSSSHDVAIDTMLGYIKDNSWMNKSDIEAVLRGPLMRMCVKYLYMEKRKGFAANPVANFHLKNGAIIWKLNWMADRSPRGLNASFGLMVNYRYIPEKYRQLSQRYTTEQHIEIADEIAILVKKVNGLNNHETSGKT